MKSGMISLIFFISLQNDYLLEALFITFPIDEMILERRGVIIVSLILLRNH